MTETESNTPSTNYDHARYEPMRRFLRFLIRVIGFTLLAKLDHVEGLENVPTEGAAILMINHIAFIDPLAVMNVLPRNIVPMAKVEAYDLPIIGIFPRLWGVIPVRREAFDRRAVQHALSILSAGEIILVAPEATRSPQLQEGKEGVAYIAHRAGVPVVPVGIEGTPGFPAFRTSTRWKQEGVRIRFGRPFRFLPTPTRPDRELLRKMTEEAMYRLASLLPPNRRGVYANLSNASLETIELL
jgi:1-acyl-sn-glycerol-3-phosphate acyltransferase